MEANGDVVCVCWVVGAATCIINRSFAEEFLVDYLTVTRVLVISLLRFLQQ